MSFEIAKAGWLHRQSSFLRRWKKNWFVLYTDGVLKYFDTPDSHVAEEAFLIPTKLLTLKTANQVTDVTSPTGLDRNCLMNLVMTDSSLVICAESGDDMRAWQVALDQARAVRMADTSAIPGAPPPYDGAVMYAQQPYGGYYGAHPPPYVVQTPQGQTTVIYADNPHYNRHYDGGDVAMGMVAGAALGTMMWGPLLWW